MLLVLLGGSHEFKEITDSLNFIILVHFLLVIY